MATGSNSAWPCIERTQEKEVTECAHQIFPVNKTEVVQSDFNAAVTRMGILAWEGFLKPNATLDISTLVLMHG